MYTNEVIELVEIPAGWKYTIDCDVEFWECEHCGAMKIFNVIAPLEEIHNHLSDHGQDECKGFKIIVSAA